MDIVSRLSERLHEAKGDQSIDVIAKRATDKGFPLSRSAVAKYLRGAHGSNPPESTLQGLAAGFELDVRELRELAGRPAGELGPYVPTELSASLTLEQRRALDELIRTFVKEGGQEDAGYTEAQKTQGEVVDFAQARQKRAILDSLPASTAADTGEDSDKGSNDDDTTDGH